MSDSSNATTGNPTTSLFRAQVERTRHASEGVPLPWSLPYIHLWSSGLVLLLCVGGLALLQLDYADKLTVEGVVQPTARPAVVVSGAAGVVQQVLVDERQHVQIGQALALIDKRSHGANGASTAQLQIDQLSARKKALNHSRSSYQVLRLQQKQVLENRLSGLDMQYQTVLQRVDLLDQRVALARVNQTKVRGLAKQGWLSNSDFHRSKLELLATRESALDQQEHLQTLINEQDQVRASLSVFAEETSVRLADLDAELLQLEHEIGKISASTEALIRAPIAGRVVDLAAHAGKQVSPGMSLLTISPNRDEPHHVEAYLPSHAAGRVRSGMSVRLRYSGYPFQEFGTGLGQIANVSEVNFEAGTRPLFRAEIDVLELPEKIDHTPAGMSVNADILLASQPLWAWLSKPIVAALARL